MIETRTELIMGMPIIISIEHDDKSIRTKSFKKVFAWFTEVDERFSPFKKSSELTLLNEGEIAYSDISADMREVLDLCTKYEKRTQGYFRHVRNGVLDPTGLVKGWAIAKAGEILHGLGVMHALINAGGDMQTIGAKADGSPWIVGIQSPAQANGIMKLVSLRNHAIATSGTYERGLHIDGIDDTPTNQIASVTVLSKNIIEADCLATAAFAMSAQGINFLESIAGVEAFMVLDAKHTSQTTGFSHFVVTMPATIAQ